MVTLRKQTTESLHVCMYKKKKKNLCHHKTPIKIRVRGGNVDKLIACVGGAADKITTTRQ